MGILTMMLHDHEAFIIIDFHELQHQFKMLNDATVILFEKGFLYKVTNLRPLQFGISFGGNG